MKKGDTAAATSTAAKPKAEGPAPPRPPEQPTSPPPTGPGDGGPKAPPNGVPAPPKEAAVDPALAPQPARRAAPSLAAAKLRVWEACPYLQKREGKGLKYTFASEADLINLLRPALLANHIVTTPVRFELLSDSEFKTGSGTVMRRAVVKMTYRFTHVPSGETEDVEMGGEGADVGDKALNKAMTDAYKYALRQWAMVETGDDPDTTSSETMARVAAPEEGDRPAIPPELRDSYDRCEAALRKATDRKQLDTYRTIYRTGRGFNTAMVGALDKVYLARLDAVENARPAAAPATSG